MQDAARILELSRNYRDYTASNLSELVKIKSFSLGEKAVAEKRVGQMRAARFEDPGKLLRTLKRRASRRAGYDRCLTVLHA